MDNNDRIREAAELIKYHVSRLGEIFDGHRSSITNPYSLLVVASCAYMMRQVQAICLLTETKGHLYYAEQAEQLVRSLCEAWAKVSWMIQPEDKTERDHRARRLYNDAIDQYQKTYEYSQANKLSTDPGLLDMIKHRKRQFREHERSSNRKLKAMPSSKDICETLGRQEIYAIYRYESGPVHASPTTTGGMLQEVQDNNYIVGGPSPPASWVKVLQATMYLTREIGPVITRGLEIEIDNWIMAGEDTWERVNELFIPLEQ